MNDNAQAWVSALRSGDYKQGRRHLRIVEGGDISYCCLGVACELYREATGEGYWTDDTFALNRSSSPIVLPSPVCRWLGLNTAWGRLPNTLTVDSKASLTDMNDSGRTFEQIADTIESEPIGLFKEAA